MISLLERMKIVFVVYNSLLDSHSASPSPHQVAEGIIKIMPCLEGDRSDSQPEANSITRSWRPRAMMVVEGWLSDLCT